MTKLTVKQQNDKIALVRASTNISQINDNLAKRAASMRKFAYIVAQYSAAASYYVSAHSSYRAARRALFKHAKTHAAHAVYARNKCVAVLLHDASASVNDCVITVKMIDLSANTFVF